MRTVSWLARGWLAGIVLLTPVARSQPRPYLVPSASGANPVASALGNRTRRDPGTAMRTYYEGLKPTRKTGTFYFGGNRNFLLWSDRQDCHGFPAPFAGNALAVLSVPGPSSLAAGLTSVPR